MRTAFLILACINLLFLAWAQWVDVPRENTSQEGLSRLPRLQLLTDNPESGDGHGSAQKMSLRRYPHPAPTQACTSLGPFKDLSSAAKAAGVLRNLGFDSEQRAEEGDAITGYWVFIGGLQSDEEVTQAAQKLEKAGFTDTHIMKSAPADRRLSVGLFSKRERAERRAQYVTQLGLQPEITERKFRGPVYWVDVPMPSSKESHLEGLLNQVGYEGASLQPCPNRSGLEDTTPQPEDQDSTMRRLPRTTVASAPK